MTEEIKYFLISKNEKNQRIDIFLSKKIQNFSRSKVKQLIKDGNVLINKQVINEQSKKIRENDKITVQIKPAQKKEILPYNFPLKIIYNDDYLVVINKQPGIVIHPGAGNHEKTLANALSYHFKNNLSSLSGSTRPGIVHRIDKDTSGAIVVAKNDFIHKHLSDQFKKHSIKRIYETLVWGVLRPLNGKISTYISRSKKNRQLMSVSLNRGKKAITNYKTIKVFQNNDLPKISLVECELETGRTHQVRVHMQHKGNTILGDQVYGKKQKKFKKLNEKILRLLSNFNRQALHAKSLDFIHPITNKYVHFEAELPKDFKELLKTLKKASI